jgi:hypothetical protein
MSFKLMLEGVDGRRSAYIGEGKELHILGADELQARKQR